MSRVKSVGGLTDLRQNTSVTFFGKLGYLHAIAGAFFMCMALCLLWDKTWVEFDTLEHLVGASFFFAATWVFTYLFGWGIEEAQVKFLKAIQINWTDVWWTSTGFLPAVVWFFAVPDSWYKASWIVSLVMLLVMGVSYILYRRKNG